MKSRVIFLECTEEIAVSKSATPEFYRLYLQSVFLALKEQGILNDIQMQHSLDILNQQVV